MTEKQKMKQEVSMVQALVKTLTAQTAQCQVCGEIISEKASSRNEFAQKIYRDGWRVCYEDDRLLCKECF